MGNEQEDFANQSSEQEPIVIDESKSLNKIDLSIIAIVVVILIIGGGAYLYLNQKLETPNENIQTTENPEPMVQEEWNTYINEEYGYSIQYPSDWTKGEEQQIISGPNNIYSTISFNKDDRKITITINGNEWLLKHETDNTKEVIIDGQKYTAYIFPNGYECYGIDDLESCSFYKIPIEKDGLWYELGATGYIDENLEDVQFDILSTFKFADSILNYSDSSNMEGDFIGIWFSSDNEYIYNDLTKLIVNKKTDIEDEDLKINATIYDKRSYGEIIDRDGDSMLIKLYGSEILSRRPPSFVYISNKTDNIVVLYNHSLDNDSEIYIDDIKDYVSDILNDNEYSSINIGNMPSDSIVDGNYYVQFLSYQRGSNIIEVDFITPNNDQIREITDPLTFGHLASLNNNIGLQNDLINPRMIPISVSEEDVNRIVTWLEAYSDGRAYEPEALVKIENGVITEFNFVGRAG